MPQLKEVGAWTRLRKARRSQLPAVIVEAIRGRPGIRHSELVRLIGKGNGTVEHHVQALLGQKRIWRLQGAGTTCYFTGTGVSPATAAMHAYLVGRTSKAIAVALLRCPGSRLTDLARLASVSPSTAHYHVSKLRRIGVLQCLDAPSGGLGLTPAGCFGLALALVSCGEATGLSGSWRDAVDLMDAKVPLAATGARPRIGPAHGLVAYCPDLVPRQHG